MNPVALALVLTSVLLPGASSAMAAASPFSDPTIQLSSDVSNAMVKTIGLGTDHRPYEPATPLGTKIGLDLGVEATIFKVPGDLASALSAAGSSSDTPPILPVPRFHVHKGIGDSAGIGVSAIRYKEYSIYGADFKMVVSNREEGPIWALRLSYTQASFGYVKTKTWTPQLLISRPVEFADPYLGIAYQSANGTISIPLAEVAGQTITATGNGIARAFMAFIGVQFKVATIGLQLTLEGAYSSGGLHSLGTKFGLSF